MKKVLHVGCGSSTLDKMPIGFQNGEWEEIKFDIDPKWKPDILGTIQDMTGVESGSMDALYSSHNIEHVYFHEVGTVIAEFKRVLKPDGFCIITCPDIKAVAESIIKKGIDHVLYQSLSGPITPNDILYGHSASIERGDHFMAHKTGFDLPGLARRFDEAHFPLYKGERDIGNKALWFIAFQKPVDNDLATEMFRNFTTLPE
ncbi:MAG: methyltransferase domain-containing protein [Kordiimonadaceae bacterium]|nr:methyltransferase domain-containing protein [Kordiimonadaceae bacterium]